MVSRPGFGDTLFDALEYVRSNTVIVPSQCNGFTIKGADEGPFLILGDMSDARYRQKKESVDKDG